MNKWCVPLLCLLMFMAIPAWAEEGALPIRSLKVYYLEFPPYYYTNESGLPDGFLLKKTRRVLRASGIEPLFESWPAKRILQQMRSEAPSVSIGWFKTPERETFAQFSEGIYRNKPLQIVYKKKLGSRFQGKESMADVFADKSLVLGVLDGYSYGVTVDGMIEAMKPTLSRVVGGFSQLLRMLEIRRFSYCIVAPEELEPLISRNNIDPDRLEHKTLSDFPEGNIRYLMFSRGVSADVVKRVNKSLDRLGEGL